MMRKGGCYFPYAYMDGYTVLALPYAGWKYFMYLILPDKDLASAASALSNTPWEQIIAEFHNDAIVSLRLPKFEVENRYTLKENLKALGIKRAFADNGPAEFYDMFEARPDTYFWINEVYQKSRLSVTEWGTEAASVTVVDMGEATSAGPGENEPKRLDFFCDQPFFFVIGEATSGVILFEGAYTGK